MKLNFKQNRKFIEAVFTLTGTVIGAGILGLPYVFAQSGFIVGLFWLVALSAILIYVNLVLGEVTLRTKETHQLPGYAERYLGKRGKNWMLFALIFGIYSALIAYLIGEGQSFSTLFTGSTGSALIFGIGFWVVVTASIYGGLRRLKQIESWGVIAIILIVIGIFIALAHNVSYANLSNINFSMFFFPFGVTLFALLGFASIPELKRELSGNHGERFLKRSIIVGILVPAVIYVMFSFIFVGILGKNVADVATISFSGFIGKILILLGIFTMLTSYVVLAFALRDSFIFDLHKKKWEFVFVSLVPLAVYILVTAFKIAGFVRVLGVGGVISGGLTGILILLMGLKARRTRGRKPEFSVRINKFIAWILTIVFVLGVIVEFLY